MAKIPEGVDQQEVMDFIIENIEFHMNAFAFVYPLCYEDGVEAIMPDKDTLRTEPYKWYCAKCEKRYEYVNDDDIVNHAINHLGVNDENCEQSVDTHCHS